MKSVGTLTPCLPAFARKRKCLPTGNTGQPKLAAGEAGKIFRACDGKKTFEAAAAALTGHREPPSKNTIYPKSMQAPKTNAKNPR